MMEIYWISYSCLLLYGELWSIFFQSRDNTQDWERSLNTKIQIKKKNTNHTYNTRKIKLIASMPTQVAFIPITNLFYKNYEYLLI